MTDVEEIEAAIREREGFGGTAPFRHALLESFATEDLLANQLPRNQWDLVVGGAWAIAPSSSC